jgi:putative two-component system response regulator
MSRPIESDVIQQAQILIVDDEMANVRLLEVILESGGFTKVRSATDAAQGLRMFQEERPDLLLLDLHMPHINGFELMERLQPMMDEDGFLPILVLTADVTPQTKRRALASGANDFLTKPVDRVEVLLRVTNLLKIRLQNAILEQQVRERTQGLEEAQHETLRRLALAAEYRDDDTGVHTRRVGSLAGQLGRSLGLGQKQALLLEQAAPLHDVGKIGIPDSILLKPGKLTPEEFEVIKSHTIIGAQILSGSSSPWLQLAEHIALTHHEKWDGTGYPRGLSGIDIPIEGRIVAVVDVFDALTHDRPYKKAWPLEEALAEIQRQSGRQFDPEVVEAFVQLHLLPHSEPLST